MTVPDNNSSQFPYVVTISSEKGGVGKTTLATNLAVFIKALNEDIPVSIFSFDNHFTIDKMFTIRQSANDKTVANLLAGEKGRDLLQVGQYGVNYIPSSHNLNNEKARIRTPMDVARMLAISDIPGILIIDTRPDLETLTENALYAADRVLIPVKDMPSLENCKNIFALFDKRGLDRKSLVLVPCLVDERIKFDGMFADQKTLLRAFAINRGYRCHDVFISKSPKVESLNTNPDGKIYPVLTHGRGTDVYGQFINLAREVLTDFTATVEPRALLFRHWIAAENQRERDAFLARLGGARKECLFCGTTILGADRQNAGYYFETSDNREAGFIESDCFLRLLSASVFNLKSDIKQDDPTLMLLIESARKSLFAFRVIDDNGVQRVDFRRMDSNGALLTSRYLNFRDHAGGMFHDEKCPLHTFMTAALSDYSNSFRDAFILVQPVPEDAAEKILNKDNYKSFCQMKARTADLFI